mgnify:CR=1 FL=1
MPTPSVLDIIRNYLDAHGFDGLFNSLNPCACKKDDLAPCAGLQEDCRTGYIVPMDCPDHEFHIGPEKTDVIDVCGGDI